MGQIIGKFKSRSNTLTYGIIINIATLNTSIPIIDTTDFGVSYAAGFYAGTTISRDTPNICFAPDPIHIEYDFSEVTQHLKIPSATISLISNYDLVQLFGIRETNKAELSSKKPEVTIFLGDDFDNPIFWGHIEEDVFSQPYARKYTEFKFNATDRTSALRYIYAPNSTLCQDDFVSMDLLNAGYSLNFTRSEDHINRYSIGYAYDQSTLFDKDLKFSSDILGGATTIRDDWWTVYDSYEEILKYLNLYALPDAYASWKHNGDYYYAMAWPANYSYHNWNAPYWDSIKPNYTYTATDAAGTDTSLSNSESYSVIKVTCNIEPVEAILKLSEDVNNDKGFYSQYRNGQKYMTEIICLGEGNSAINAFHEELTQGINISNYDGIYKIDNFVYVKQNDAWDFSAGYSGNQREQQDYTTHIQKEQNATYAINQHNILKWMGQNTETYIRPGFVSFGRSKKIDLKDNAVEESISMKDYLYIPIWGIEQHTQYHSLQYKFNRYTAAHPLVKYTPYQNITLTPASDDVINYIIINGKILLNPLQQVTGMKWFNEAEASMNHVMLVGGSNGNPEVQRKYPYLWWLRSTNTYADTMQLLNLAGTDPNYRIVPMPDNDQGAYYTQKFWQCTDIASKTYTQAANDEKWAYGYLDNSKNQQMKFEYVSREDGAVDKVSKIPILKCELKVGDKYCCELSEGIDNFVWLTEAEAAAQNIEPVIYLGIDPKIDDYIIGKEYDIRNSIHYSMNLEGKGMAIPIKSTDHISGKFEFKIITPADPIWEDVSYTAGSFWSHSHWETYYRYIMEKTQAIMIQDLKIEVQTDNALANVEMTTSDNDLVYASDMNPRYSEELDVDLSICSGLSSDECAEYSMKNEISKSYVIDNDTDAPYLGVLDEDDERGEFYTKQEEIICDSLFKECCRPKTIVHTTVKRPLVVGDSQFNVKLTEENIFNHINDVYFISYWDPDKPVKIMKANFNLKDETVECDFKEFDLSLVNL